MHTHTAPARWSKSSPSWGSALRTQRNYYAFLVAMVMTDGQHVCPCCDAPLILQGAASQVDRVNPADDYREGNVVLVCEACNQDRSRLQAVGRDWQDVDAYASHVADASAMVTVPTQAEARRWAAGNAGGTGRVSRYA